MAEYKVYTHAFDFYYKVAPTASGVLGSDDWYNQDFFDDGIDDNYDYVRRWYNLYAKQSFFPAYPGILTRNTPQLSGSVSNNGAIAWGSAASDFLWNVLTPSMSVDDWTTGAGHFKIYSFSYNSESFFHTEYVSANNSTPLGSGSATYPITSSWIAYEPNMIAKGSGSIGTGVGYTVRSENPSTFTWPASFYQPSTFVYSLPTSATPPTTTYPNPGVNPTSVTYEDSATGSFDGRFFDLAGGCGITRASISASLVAFAANSASAAGAAREICTQELKKRRLFFPTISTGSMPLAAGSPGAWLELMQGKPSNEFFTENGGIYNVKFNLKRDTIHDFYPDSGQGSELKVFIADVRSTIPTPNNRIPGARGWYPPDNNIITIKNQPAMTFYNPSTGFFIESFNINVVQYGIPAQLVFEAGGDLSTDNYFGCIIDDVSFCKVGVSTDPNLIKDETLAEIVEEEASEDFYPE